MVNPIGTGSEQNWKNRYKKVLQKFIDMGLLVYFILAVLIIVAQFIIPGFMGLKNISNILKMASFTGIAAIGQTMAILLGGIDMSVSNVVTFSNIVAAQLMMGKNENILLAMFTVIVLGAICGTVNAVGINYLKIPPMIMTLGLGTVIQGIALLYSKGAPKGNAAPLLRHIVNDATVLNTMTWLMIIWLMISVVVILFLRKTVSGGRVYAVGSNPISARFSGINAKAVILGAYIVSGITAAVTGLALAGYTGTASAESGAPYSMNSIVAVVIGGTAITGGKGGYGGTVAGAIIITVLDSILTVVKIPQSGRMIAQGMIILIMVMIYGRDKKRLG